MSAYGLRKQNDLVSGLSLMILKNYGLVKPIKYQNSTLVFMVSLLSLGEEFLSFWTVACATCSHMPDARELLLVMEVLSIAIINLVIRRLQFYESAWLCISVIFFL